MNFSCIRPLTLIVALAVVTGSSLSGCHRTITAEERSLRDELRHDLRTHSFAAALPLARKVLRFAPRDNGAWARLAQAQAGLHDFGGLRQTLADWRKAVRRTSPKFDEYRGDVAQASGHPEEALAAWRKAIAHKDPRQRVFVKIARVEEATGHWPEAAAAWSQALKIRRSVTALLQRAHCYRHLHKWEAARADLEQAAWLAPNDPKVQQANVDFAALAKFVAEVRDSDRQLATAPNDANLLADRALLFLRAQAPDLALDDATRAARLAPAAVRPKLFAMLALRALGREKEADRLGVRSAQLETLTPDFLQTLRQLDVGIAADPNDAELRVNRAWQLNEIGQPQLALDDAEKAIALDARCAGAHAEASYALAKLGRDDQAYEQIKRATELDPNFSTAWQYRGELEMHRADYSAAVGSLTQALAINQTAVGLSRREECYRKLGLLAQAEADRKALAQIHPSR